MAILPLHHRKDQHHQVQLNVFYTAVDGEAIETTVWATGKDEGLSTLLKYGMILKGVSPDPDSWVPPHRILRVDLMGTVDPAQARAAADKYNEECPRC